MATSNPKKTGDKTEEQMLLEAKLKEMTREKKAVLDATREADERLRQISEEETRIRDRLHQIEAEEIKKRQHMEMIEELNVLRRENSELNESLTKLKGTLQRTTNDPRTQQKEKREKEEEIEKLTKHIQCLEDKISNAEIQRHDHDDLPFTESAREAEMQAELAVLRTENEQLKTDRTTEMMEQMVQVSQLKENLQRITSLLKTQQKKIKRLEEDKFAVQQIAVETQLRQLNELESRETLTEEIRQLKERLTILHRQHQQPTTVEHRRGHADELRRVYTKVSQKLDAQSVARNMFQCNALTLKELESIQSKHSEPVKAAERLLDIVMNQSGSVYEFFMNALKLTGQKHVCEIIVIGTDEGPENDVDHTPIIRQHYVFLVDNLDSKHSGLVGELYQAEVLNNEERESVSFEMTSFTQNVKLLSMLSRKTKDQFDKFLDALNKTGQQHVRNHITGRQALHRMPTCAAVPNLLMSYIFFCQDRE